MIAALRYELVRIRTIRSTWWLTGLAAVLGMLIALGLSWATSYDFGHGNAPVGDDLTNLGPAIVTQLSGLGLPCLIAFVLAMTGIFGWGHEYRHGMIRASLTALNSRSSLWAAKFIVVGAWVATVTFVTLVLCGLIGVAFLHDDGVPIFTSTTWEVIGREIGYVVVLTWLAMAFTALTRSQAFAMVMIFLWPLLVESIIAAVVNLTPGLRDHTDLLRFLPFQAGFRMIDVSTQADSFFGDPLSAGGGFVVFGGVCVVLMVASLLLFRRRDA